MQRQGSVCPLPRIPFFWFTSIWVWKRPVSVEVLAPTRLGLRGSHVRRKFRKWTTLRSKSSTLKGLLFAGWKSRCKSFVARKIRIITWAKCEQESCHLTSNNQLLFMSWISLGDSILGLYCIAWLTQESVSSRIFVRKKGMRSCSVQTDVHSRSFPQKAEKGKVNGSDATTRFPRASWFWETHAFCSRNMGAHVQCTSAKKLVSSNFAKILKVATKIRETCDRTLFTPSSPVKATKLYCFCLSDKRSPKSPINVKR